jgi:molecular chaperone GrpE
MSAQTQKPEEASAPETEIPVEVTPPEPQKSEEVLRLEGEVAKFRDQWMRAVAETENVRKRAQREQEETSKYAVTGFAGELVSVLENLKRASESIAAHAGDEIFKTVGQGVKLTLQELLNIFEKHGIKRIDPLNQKFDHNFHQAVAQAERGDIPAGTVVQVVQAGYIISDRLLRPAMVVVSKAVDPANKVDTTA